VSRWLPIYIRSERSVPHEPLDRCLNFLLLESLATGAAFEGNWGDQIREGVEPWQCKTRTVPTSTWFSLHIVACVHSGNFPLTRINSPNQAWPSAVHRVHLTLAIIRCDGKFVRLQCKQSVANLEQAQLRRFSIEATERGRELIPTRYLGTLCGFIPQLGSKSMYYDAAQS
jgi:hypothetical protein